MAPSAYSLERLIQNEIKLYQQYLQILTEEKTHITKFNSEKVAVLTEKRERVLAAMDDAQQERMELCKQFPNSEGQKLSALIEQHYSGPERKKLLSLVGALRQGVSIAQKKTKEFGYITRFGLGMVEGLLSIFWSATQHVTKSYTRLGGIKENATPAGTRSSSVLKKA